MSDIMGTSWVPGQDSAFEAFFKVLTGEQIQKVGDANLPALAPGITSLGNAMKTWSGLDMAAIVGNNWTPGKETSFESFIGALVKATEKIKDPAQLQNVAVGIRALGEAMQTFTKVDTEKIAIAMSGAGWKLK